MVPVLICEVGPRDGLQNEDRVLSVAARVDFVDRLSDCGFSRIEVGSFVSARRVPKWPTPSGYSTKSSPARGRIQRLGAQSQGRPACAGLRR